MPDPIAAPEALAALATLFLLEIALGLENALLIGFGVSELPGDARKRTRRFGFLLALGMRLVLVGLLVWVLSAPAGAIPFSPWAITWHDLVLFAGGLFLIHRAVSEIDDILSGEKGRQAPVRPRASAVATLVAIALVSVILAMDTALLAVGVAPSLPIMALAIIFAWTVMAFIARPLGRLVATFPAIRLLSLGILLLVGGTLMVRGLGYQVPLVALHLVTLAVAIVGAGYAASASMRGRTYGTLRILPPVLVPEHAFRPAMEREPELDLGTAVAEPSAPATATEHAGDATPPIPGGDPEPTPSTKPRHPGLERETEPRAPEVIEPMVMPPSIPEIEPQRGPRGNTPPRTAQDRDEDALFAAPYDAWPAETATQGETETRDDTDAVADEDPEETNESPASDDDLMDSAGRDIEPAVETSVGEAEEASDASEPQPALVEAQEPVPKADGKTRQKVRKPVRRRRAASRRGKR